MKDVLIIEDPETAKVLIDETRLKILHLLRMGEHTISELSQFLELSPQAVFYHLKILERHGLVEVIRIVNKKNLIEKYYRATARIFLVSYLVFESEEFEEKVRDIVAEAIDVFGLKIGEKEFTELMRRYLSLKSRAIKEILSKRRKALHKKMSPVIDFLAVMRMVSYPEFSKLVSRYRELEGS